MNFLFPIKITTPHIPLGIKIDDGLCILKEFGNVRETNEDEHCFRVDTQDFSFAIYEENGKVRSVWYSDPSGRIWGLGKNRKIKLYLKRYGNLPDWEERMDNGWMKYFFNPKSNSAMVYGIHNDVIRFNKWEGQ